MFVINLCRLSIFALTIFVFFSCKPEDREAIRGSKKLPNILLIMTDDQGIGDVGFMGNPYVKTPNLDQLADESLNLTNFYVSPVCAPTRASIMTGRYSERTGVYDTFNGGAIMGEDEVTIAEVLKENGYTTGIFGKWHLGDNYPYRPIDQGFDEALVHRGGGMGQPGDFLNFFAMDSSYFDPVLFHNGQQEQRIGYCSDIFAEGAIEFIKRHNSSGSEQPFFVYLPFNAPHTPLQLPQNYYDMYKDLEFDADVFPVKPNAVGRMTEADKEAAKRVYGMVTNIDDNIGRLMDVLNKEGLEQNTIVVFLTDNGPQQVRYKLGLRGRKSHVYSGGVRVPCLIRYPARYTGKQNLNIPLAHIDLFPSLLDLCSISQPDHEIDGRSFAGEGDASLFSERTLFFEWGRGFPVKYRNFAAMRGGYKLVGNTEADGELSNFELYYLKTDPYEKVNVIARDSIIAAELKKDMDTWYEEIIAEQNNNRILPAYVGTEYENPTVLNRNDAKGTPVAWRQENVLGYWDVKVVETGSYNVTLQFIRPISEPGNIHLKLYPQYFIHHNEEYADQLKIENIKLKQGEFKLEAYYTTNKGEYIFPLYVSLERLN